MGKKTVILVIAIGLALIATSYVWAIWDSSKTIYHTADDVRIDIGTDQYSIQEAYDLGFLSGGGGSSCTGNFTFEDGNGNCRTSTDIVNNAGGITTYNIKCVMNTIDPNRNCTIECGAGFGLTDVTTSGHCGGFTYLSGSSALCNRPGAWECECRGRCFK